ncbi:MAG: hypothetical protein ABJG68_08650 [Crocinitomicaceae bacterium]
MLKNILYFSFFSLLLSCGGQSYYDIDNEDDYDDYDYLDEEFEDIFVDEMDASSNLSTPIEADWELLISNEIAEDQIINFEGYLGRLPNTMYNSDNRELTLDVYERRNQIEGNKMRVDVVIGTTPGHVRSLPKDYEQSDLRVVCDQDIIAGVASHVRIQGEYGESSGTYYNYLDLKKIRILSDDFDESVFDEAVKLHNKVIDTEELDDVYSYMDCSLSLSSYMSDFSGKYTINIKQDDNKYTERAYVYIGNTAGKMEALPTSYSDKDFIIYDYLGNPHKGTEGKFRLYGTFNRLDVESKGVFTVEEFKKL